MNVRAHRPSPAREAQAARWVSFAGVMLLIAGILNVIGGIAAIDDANVYAGDAHFVFGDLETWGWVILITGAVQALTGLGIFQGSQAARWLGVCFVSLNLMAQLFLMPAQPLWSLALFGLDFLVLFALLVYMDPEYR
jgi:hypothetical protein